MGKTDTEKQALTIDIDSLMYKAIPTIVTASNNLKNAESISASIDIPDDFEYSVTLSYIPNKIRECEGNAFSIKELIADLIEQYLANEEANKGIVNGLGDVNYDGLRNLILNGEPITLGKKTILIIPGTIDGFIDCLQLILDQHYDEKWEWRGLGTVGGLTYAGPNRDNTFEDVINNENRATCCATYVSMALYLAGFVTEENFEGVDSKGRRTFNVNTPASVKNACKQIECEQIDDYNDLKKGDVVIIYDKEDPNHAGHVEVYGGKDADGDDIFYSEGSTYQVQNGGPIKAGPYWHKAQNWDAYRIPINNTDDTTLNSVDIDGDIAVSLGADTTNENGTDTLEYQTGEITSTLGTQTGETTGNTTEKENETNDVTVKLI